MTYNNCTIAQLVEAIQSMQDPQQAADLKKAIDYRLHLPALRNALFDKITGLLEASPATVLSVATSVADVATNGDYVQQDGIRYELSQWVTLSEYASLHGLKSTNTVNNWINRGIVPPDCTVELRSLNSLRLIKNQPYKLPTGVQNSS